VLFLVDFIDLFAKANISRSEEHFTLNIMCFQHFTIKKWVLIGNSES